MAFDSVFIMFWKVTAVTSARYQVPIKAPERSQPGRPQDPSPTSFARHEAARGGVR